MNLKKIAVPFIGATVAMLSSVAQAEETSTAILEMGVAGYRTPWFEGGDTSLKQNTSNAGFTAAASFLVPFKNNDAIAFDFQTEAFSAKSTSTPIEDLGPTHLTLLSSRYEIHFSDALVAPFVAIGKPNQKDGGSFGYMSGLQGMTKNLTSNLDLFGTVGYAKFIADTDSSTGTSDAAFIGPFAEIGAIAKLDDSFSVKGTFGYGKTNKSKQEGLDVGVYDKASYYSAGIKAIYQPQSWDNVALTFGYEQQRYNLVDDGVASNGVSEELKITSHRVMLGMNITFGGKIDNSVKLRPLALTLDPLRASVYSEVSDSVSGQTIN